MNFLEKMETTVDRWVPPQIKATAILQGFGLWKIPLLFACQPRVLLLNDEQIEVEIPLNRFTRNHLRSMYFGALAIGADSVVGLLAVHHIRQQKGKVNLVFKDFRADFLKRAEGSVVFRCTEGKRIQDFVREVIESGERKNLSVPAVAVLKKDPTIEIAQFTLTLSLKRKG
jgi:acyl-coenzyme A thioesterase PaaI-like protein